jgi:hypothetical protein
MRIKFTTWGQKLIADDLARAIAGIGTSKRGSHEGLSFWDIPEGHALERFLALTSPAQALDGWQKHARYQRIAIKASPANLDESSWLMPVLFRPSIEARSVFFLDENAPAGHWQLPLRVAVIEEDPDGGLQKSLQEQLPWKSLVEFAGAGPVELMLVTNATHPNRPLDYLRRFQPSCVLFAGPEDKTVDAGLQASHFKNLFNPPALCIGQVHEHRYTDTAGAGERASAFCYVSALSRAGARIERRACAGRGVENLARSRTDCSFRRPCQLVAGASRGAAKTDSLCSGAADAGIPILA